MSLTRAIDITDTYFQYRNIGSFGFIKYSIIKKIIKYILNIDCDRKCRRIFDKMIALGYFEILRFKKHSILYLYNPKQREYTYRLTGLVEFLD